MTIEPWWLGYAIAFIGGIVGSLVSAASDAARRWRERKDIYAQLHERLLMIQIRVYTELCDSPSGKHVENQLIKEIRKLDRTIQEEFSDNE